MTTDKGKSLVDEFLGTLHRLTYSQPIVAKTVGASEVNLTNWRSRREPLLKAWTKDGGRIFYTGLGLIEAGLLNELNKVFGLPAKSSFIAKNLALMYTEKSLRNPDDEFIITFLPYDEDDNTAAANDVSGWREVGFSSVEWRSQDFTVSAHHPEVVVPITSMIVKWAMIARMNIAARE